MRTYNKSRVSARGGALPSAGLPLFDWAQSAALLQHPAIRHLVRTKRMSPALALVYAELTGLGGCP